jgi:hypothetical protein
VNLPPHGTRTRYVNHDRCRCAACRAANTAYQRSRTSGEQATVDASETRAHLRTLQAHGIGSRQAAQVGGIARTTIQEIRSGRRARIYRRTAEAILGVTTCDHVAQRSYVDGARTHALIADLRGMGMRRCAIARALGYKTEALQIAGRGRVTVRNARRIEVLHRLAANQAGRAS